MKDIVSCENTRKSDAYTIEHSASGIELMWRAAEGIYKSVRWHGRVGIVCGSGNNAGDGYALALILKQNGVEAELIRLSDKLSCDGEYYYKKCVDVAIKTVFFDEMDTLCDYDIIVDCILGTGFSGEVQGVYRRAIEAINKSGAYVVSADINSGLNGDNGLCDIAVKSDITVSIGTLKSGHILSRAKDFIGELVNVDIGIKILDKPYKLIEESDVAEALKPRANFSNKGTYGYATIIGGCMEYSGAIKLANLALSALKTGVGVVKLATARTLFPAVAPYLLESTFYPLSDSDGYIKFNPDEIDGALKGVRAVAIGMGMGTGADAYPIIKHVLENYEIPVIIDADGLNALSRGDMSILKGTKCTVILTPHPGELERLSGVKIADMLKNPIELSKRFAKEYGVILLLKGTATIVTDGEELYLINQGCAGMASAGSGDVLSGIMLAICAQNRTQGEAILNVCASAYINGLAGEIAQERKGEISMLSSDTVNAIPDAIMKITKKRSD